MLFTRLLRVPIDLGQRLSYKSNYIHSAHNNSPQEEQYNTKTEFYIILFYVKMSNFVAENKWNDSYNRNI